VGTALPAPSPTASIEGIPGFLPPDVGTSLDWFVERNRPAVVGLVAAEGRVLFRGFALAGSTGFRRTMGAVSERFVDYVYGSTPRTPVANDVYTSTEYPAEQFIPLHNEMAYSRRWPMRIWFACVRPAEQGGETPLAASASVLAALDPALVRLFEERKVRYTRRYGPELDLSWQRTFGTDERGEADRICRSRGIEAAWLPDGTLVTTQVCAAVARHPVTAERLWFNQAHLFHRSSLGAELAALLERRHGGLPRDATFGDGSPIPEALLAEIKSAYRENEQCFGWQAGDVLLLDNMRWAHGRRPFQGRRRVLVGMTDEMSAP
jgi:alpha-ketoglutarate-dependent taurine dioxygenase